MTEDIRIAFKKLTQKERDLIIGLIGRDPLQKAYRLALFGYILILSICLLWPFDMSLPQKNGVNWLDTSQGIEFIKNGQIHSRNSTNEIYKKLKEGSGLTVEVWVSSSDLDQSGPARIISYSLDPERRNFTLGQQKDRLIFRLRTIENDLNGVFPFHEIDNIFDSKDIKHIVVSYDFNQQNVYVDGVKVASKDRPKGNFRNWNTSFPLLIGNEATWDRPWKGKIFYAAIYNRSLEPEEVQKHFSRGQSIYKKKYCNDLEKLDGLLVQYCFDEGKGKIIHDSSGKNPVLPLIAPRWIQHNNWESIMYPAYRYSIKNSKEVILNIVGFVPFGFLLHAFLRVRPKKNKASIIFVILCGTFVSLTFEFLQYFSMTRYSSLFDVLHNTIGTGLGVAIDRWYSAQLHTSIANIT